MSSPTTMKKADLKAKRAEMLRYFDSFDPLPSSILATSRGTQQPSRAAELVARRMVGALPLTGTLRARRLASALDELKRLVTEQRPVTRGRRESAHG